MTRPSGTAEHRTAASFVWINALGRVWTPLGMQIRRASSGAIRRVAAVVCAFLRCFLLGGAYRAAPNPRRKADVKARFERIFRRRTGFAALGRLLVRLQARRAELVLVFDRPQTRRAIKGSENDIPLSRRFRPPLTIWRISVSATSDHG